MDDNSSNGLIGGVIGWFQHPFNTKGSALNWILWVGILVIAIWFWNHILLSIQQEV